MARPNPELVRYWAEKLADSGFVDIEDHKGRLKQPNRRTKTWEARDAAADFYSLLDEYMHTTLDIPRLDRRILELYAQGEKLESIAYDVYRSLAFVKNVIYRHRDYILHKK